MKKIYLVRHGESVSNLTEVVQGPADKLTAKGQMQAVTLAERIKHLDFKNLLVSDYVRAKQTAEPLLRHTNCKPLYTPLLREVDRPSSIVGSPIRGDSFMHYVELAKEHLSNPVWHFEDEENFHDIVIRVKDFFALVDSLDGDTMVVSHGRFIIYLVMYVLLSGKLTPAVWSTDFATFTTTNTGITVFSFKEPQNLWALTTYNDHAHFAE